MPTNWSVLMPPVRAGGQHVRFRKPKRLDAAWYYDDGLHPVEEIEYEDEVVWVPDGHDPWRYYNTMYHNTTAMTTTANFIDYNQWAFTTAGTTSYTHFIDERQWYYLNDRYERVQESRAEAAARRRREVLANLTRYAQHQAFTLGTEALDWHRLGLTVPVPADLTADERTTLEDAFQRRREERREAMRAEEVRKAQAEEAKVRAEKLLVSLLSAKQKREWLQHKRVTEVAPSGRVWRLFPEWSGGATIMDGEARRATLCIHANERIPEADNMVALLLAIRHGEEDHLIKVGVVHSGQLNEEERAIKNSRTTEGQRNLANAVIRAAVVA